MFLSPRPLVTIAEVPSDSDLDTSCSAIDDFRDRRLEFLPLFSEPLYDAAPTECWLDLTWTVFN